MILPALQHHDPVEIAQRCETMRDRDHGRPASGGERLADRFLGFAVECGGRFIQQQDRRVLEERARIAIRCRWPPESLTPRSPTMVASPPAASRRSRSAPRSPRATPRRRFDLYLPIKELHSTLVRKEREYEALRVTLESNILPKVSKREHDTNISRIEALERELDEIKENLSLYATNISEIVDREMVEQKRAREDLLQIRTRLESALQKLQCNITNNRHIKSSHFEALLHYFPAVNQNRLARVEEFHSEVARLLRAELSESSIR